MKSPVETVPNSDIITLLENDQAFYLLPGIVDIPVSYETTWTYQNSNRVLTLDNLEYNVQELSENKLVLKRLE